MKSRGQKALLNSIVLGGYQITHFICGLILPRFYLLNFGSEYTGIASSITQLLSFISILQFGIAGSSRFALYKVLANNDVKGISGIVNATQSYMRKIAVVLLAYIGILAFIYPYIADTTLPVLDVFLLVLIIGASSFSRYFFGLTYQILLTADQRLYIYNGIAIVSTILNTGLAVLLMQAGYNIHLVKLGSATIFVLTPILLSLYVRKTYQIDRKVPQDKSVLKSRWDVMWHSIANIVHDSTDLIVLTIFTNVKYVSVYTVHYLVINGLFQIMSVFTNSLEAAFGNMFAKNEQDTAYHNLEQYEFFIGSFVSVVFSCALVLIVPFVQLYTTGVTDINYTVPVFAPIAVVAQMVMCIRQPYLTIVRAAGHYKQTRNGAIAEAIINIVLSIVLTHFFGIIGVAIGTLVANIFRTLQFATYLRKNIINRPLRKPVLIMLWITINTIVVCALSQLVLNAIVINSWWLWIIAGVACCCIALVVTILSAFVFYRKQLFATVNFAKRLLFKRKKSSVQSE